MLTIIIDQNIFRGTSLPQLYALAQQHNLVLIPELIYECATSKDRDEMQLLSRITNLLKAGAYVGLEERDIILNEANHLKIAREVIDYDMTDRIRKEGFPSENSIHSEQLFIDVLQNLKWRKEMSVSIVEYAKMNCLQVLHDECQECGKMREYYEKYVNDIGKNFGFEGIRKLVLSATKKLTTRFDEYKYCTSKRWFSWQNIFLVIVLAYVHAIKIARNNNSLIDTKFEHDCMDISYVARLAIADVLISNDKDCTIPLAKAAYPNKFVYSEVPI